jgi:pyruvate dehydrogenase complex dehydrogenase (E1) component
MSINKDWTKEDNTAIFGRSPDRILQDVINGSIMTACVDSSSSRMQATVGLATKKYLDRNPEVKEHIHELTAEKLNKLRIEPNLLP